MATQTCGKCGGRGYIKQYSHIAAGVCFECNGHGVVQTSGKAIAIKARKPLETLPGCTVRETADILNFANDYAFYLDFTAVDAQTADEMMHFVRSGICTRDGLKFSYVDGSPDLLKAAYNKALKDQYGIEPARQINPATFII